MSLHITLPVPGGPANKTALPAIFLDRIISTTTPAAWKGKYVKCTLKKKEKGLLQYCTVSR